MQLHNQISNWLKDYLETKLDVYQVASTLTNIGLEVESIKDRTNEFKPFTVAKIINASKHPNADKLKVCIVETIEGNFQVVCGAPNIKIGMQKEYMTTYIKLQKRTVRKH